MKKGLRFFYGKRQGYIVAWVAAGITAMIVFSPGLRKFLSPAFGWTIVILAAIVALAYFGNILMVVYYVYTGYGPEAKELERGPQNENAARESGEQPNRAA